MRPPLLLYVLGTPPPEVQSGHGRFEDWFERLASPHAVALRPVDGTAPGAAPDPRDFAGIVVTGSPASLAEPEPWMDDAVELVERAAAAGIPLLGVCFGHQLVGAAAGARVVQSPLGWELGSFSVELTAAGRADPLFSGLPERFEVNLSHRDVIAPDSVQPGDGLTVLASNCKSPVQAVAFGDAVRGVQFHPEFSGAATRAYLETRRRDLAADADSRGAPDEHPDRLETRDCPAGERVFENWLRFYVLAG